MIAAVLLAIFGFAAPAAMAAEGERVLEPRLSLTGGCGTSTVDPIPDPGLCPLEKEGGPGVPGVDHPPSTFSDPRAVATDELGNIYVSNFGNLTNGSKGRVDVFCSDGTYISELLVPGATSVAIDSEGILYVFSTSQGKVLLYKPDAGYAPAACEIGYGETAPVTVTSNAAGYSGLAINRDNDHLFVDFGSTPGVVEYKSAAEGNEKVRTGPGPSWGSGAGMAVDAARDRMYASGGLAEERIDIFDLNTVEGTPPNDQYKKIGSIVESSVPSGELGTGLSIAVDEGNGNVFVLDGENCNLYEFKEDGTFVQKIAADFLQCIPGLEIAVDNGPTSPNGKLSEEAGKGRFLYVPSNRTGIGHSYAFFISSVGPPEVLSAAAANISEDEAELQAAIDPNNLPTTYSFEYKVEGAPTWTPAGGGTLPTGESAEEVSATTTGLAPGTSYLFRVSATNEEGSDEAEGSFATYPSVPSETSLCANALLRTGLSALLPDCRAYELVSPADTNGRAPVGTGRQGGVFTTRQVSPAGDKIPFRVEGGSLPGLGGTGSLLGDPYLATRTSEGWSTTYTGPAGDEATDIGAGTTSPDQNHSFWQAAGRGSAVLGGTTAYVRYPDGHSELLGQGSLGNIDPESAGQLISEGGGHIVFSTGSFASASTAVQLEPDAAPDGTRAIYDRTPDGITHVVSLKPGDEPFGTGENANYQGASLDGIGIAFKVGSTLYLRYDNEETFAIGTGVDVAGVAEGGNRIFYMEGGDLKAFDVGGGEATVFADTAAAVVPVTVSADGSTAYFVSETAIAESGPNPEGDEPQAGQQNLYRSVEGQIAFVATVTERDVDGALISSEISDGLGLWAAASSAGTLGRVPARATPDGSALLFKSRAALTDYDPEDNAQIYRYAAGELQCLSCIPTGAAADSDATLQSEFREGQELFSTWGWPENLRADGRRAFFESSEALVANDSDGLRDVYEWEDEGVGSCTRAEGCVYLISSPQSQRDEYLWAVSPSGNDAFFLSSELLVGSDADETPSIYDARVGGGFAEDAQSECEGGEGCRPQLSPPPTLPGGNTSIFGPGDQAKPPKPCPKGKHKVKKNGKVTCAKNKKKNNKSKKNRASADKKGGSR
ncbi:MAG TPA: hypothetical protein VIT89_00600 [Solirubrobacterales bacterium]